MRLMFFVGLPRAPLRQVLTALHAGTLVEAERGGVQRVRTPYGISHWYRLVRSVRDNMPASEAPSGKWSIWIVACPRDRDQSRSLFRWLGRYRIAEPDRVLGPYDRRRFAALAEPRTDDDGNALKDLLGPCVPWVIMGESPVAIAGREYNPTDEEIINP